MGRHTVVSPRRRPSTRVLGILAGVTSLVLAGGGGWALLRQPGAPAAEAAPTACTTTVRLTVAPELAEPVGALFRKPVTVGDGGCVDVAVSPEEPLQTTANLASLDSSRLPHLWVPDSSLWQARVTSPEAGLEPVGAVASSPLVVATSRAAVDALGWGAAPPSWGEALGTGRPVAVPDLAASAEGLSALAAVRASLGGGETGDNAVVSAVLAATRGAVPSPAAALEAAAAGAADAPLVPVGEQEVFAANRGQDAPALVAVYPRDGSPALDYPLLRVGAADGAEDAAVQAVAAVLTGEDARSRVRRAGFRDPAGAAPTGAGPESGVQEAAPAALTLAPADVQQLLQRLASLAKPSRLLAVMDVSRSMEAQAGQGQTRIMLARDAAKSALALFPDSSAIGIWTFASGLTPTTDWEEVSPVRGLAEDAGGVSQRQALSAALDSLPDRLSPGGTSLYDTALGAVRAARESYDPAAVSTVVLITDGRNEDSTGIGLDALLQTLQAEADPQRPVRVIAVGLGPDADNAALQQIAAASGGAAYAADDPHDLQTVLFDALRRRG